MSATAGASETRFTKIGTKLAVQSNAPSNEFAVVFEDDGDTGYFYALAPNEAAGLDLLDAVHVYNAEGELRDADIRLEIAWSANSRVAGLRLNASLWALFDFAARTGWSRSNFPPPAGLWQMGGERPDWDDTLIHRL